MITDKQKQLLNEAIADIDYSVLAEPAGWDYNDWVSAETAEFAERIKKLILAVLEGDKDAR